MIYIGSSVEELCDGWQSFCTTDTEQLAARIEREVSASRCLLGQNYDTRKCGRSNGHRSELSITEYVGYPQAGSQALRCETLLSSSQAEYKRENPAASRRFTEFSPSSRKMAITGDTLSSINRDGISGVVPYPEFLAISKHYYKTVQEQYSVWEVGPRNEKGEIRLVLGEIYPRDEPESITKLRRKAYMNGLHAGSFLFLCSRSVAGCRL